MFLALGKFFQIFFYFQSPFNLWLAAVLLKFEAGRSSGLELLSGKSPINKNGSIGLYQSTQGEGGNNGLFITLDPKAL